MKRAPLVLSGTALGLVGVLGYHTASTPSALTGASVGATSSAASTTSSATATTSTPTTSSSSSSSAQTRVATGDDVSYQYGDLQLKVTMSGSRITDVTVLRLNESDPRSQSIDEQAIPQLRQEALAAQSAQIDGISGASYTSQAYEQSLQSAIDKLRSAQASS